jgi:hypothetical protein
MLRLEEPTPGVAHLAAFSMGEAQALLSVAVYLYGDRAKDVAANQERKWQAWMKEHFGGR